MNYEEILKREDGTQYKVSVSLRVDSYQEGFEYRIDVWTREKGKRKWMSLPDTLYDYQFRDLSMEDREKHRQENQRRFVSEDEILTAKTSCWMLLKPSK